MDQAPQPEDAAANTEREERRADVQRRIDEVAGVLAETLLGMWRAKHRAERRGEAWPPPEPPKPEPPRTSVLSDKPKAPAAGLPRARARRRAGRERAAADDVVPGAGAVAGARGREAHARRPRVRARRHGRRGTRRVRRRGSAASARGPGDVCRRQGHGRSLVEFIVRHAYQTGVGRMYAASGTPWFAEEVGFEVRERTMLPEDARRLPGIIDAPRNAFVFELTPTMSGRRAPRRSVPRSAVEALLTRSERKAAR
jgi:hypothetical protein